MSKAKRRPISMIRLYKMAADYLQKEVKTERGRIQLNVITKYLRYVSEHKDDDI